MTWGIIGTWRMALEGIVEAERLLKDGGSSLDAVELMNIGANYLREHVTSDVRIHYVITDGGVSPNTVPDKACVWYDD